MKHPSNPTPNPTSPCLHCAETRNVLPQEWFGTYHMPTPISSTDDLKGGLASTEWCCGGAESSSPGETLERWEGEGGRGEDVRLQFPGSVWIQCMITIYKSQDSLMMSSFTKEYFFTPHWQSAALEWAGWVGKCEQQWWSEAEAAMGRISTWEWDE